MSMISMQVDRLRDRAVRVEIFLKGCTDAIPMDTHVQLRSAADTIWELRNKLAGVVDQQDEIERLKAENAKLRAERDYLLMNSNPTATELRRVRSAWKKDREENAKLRELLKDYLNAPCVECDPWREGWQGCKHCDGGNCTLATRAIEMGIEAEE